MTHGTTRKHSDDDIVDSVLGGEAAAPAQPASDSMSLSAVSEQMQQSMPAPVEHREAAPAAPAAFSGMPSLSWGNPMAGSSAEEAPAAPAAPAAQAAPADTGSDDQMLSLSAVRNQEESKMGITESDTRFAPAPPVYAQPAPVAYTPPVAALATVAAPVVQPAPVTIDSYVAANPAPAVEEAPKPQLEMSSFSSHMGYRMNMHADDATPTSDNILSLRKQNMGNSYDSFLKQARTNRWKRAMDVTMNMKPPGGGGVNNAYLMDLS